MTPPPRRTLMAALAAVVTVLTHVRLVAGWRWHLLRNGLRRKSNRFDLAGLIIVGILSAFFVFGLCFAFFAGAYNFLSAGRPGWFSLLFWWIFVLCQLFPMFASGFCAACQFHP